MCVGVCNEYKIKLKINADNEQNCECCVSVCVCLCVCQLQLNSLQVDDMRYTIVPINVNCVFVVAVDAVMLIAYIVFVTLTACIGNGEKKTEHTGQHMHKHKHTYTHKRYM